ncbi:MAG: sigma-70 family RNA polymerase sigma factor [Solirubrobacteraceae bacterium]
MTATRPLSRDEIAAELDRIRGDVIRAGYRKFRRREVRWEDLEDAYGEITLEALGRTFMSVAELGGFVHRALTRDAQDVIKSAAFRTAVAPGGEAWESAVAGDQSPEQAAIVREARAWLDEFLAEMPDQDRQVAVLAFDDWPARAIATKLGLPYREVTKTVHRARVHVDRLSVIALDPEKMCSRRLRDVIRWQQTGERPLALTLHCRRCAACCEQVRAARDAVRRAILPLIPVGALPLTAPGAIGRLYHAAALHPATQRANDALARVRKWAPVGGGGGAAIAAKLAVGGAAVVVGAGAAIHAAVDGHRTTPHHHRPAVIVHPRIVHTNVITATTPAVTVRTTTTATTTTAIATPAPPPAATTTTATTIPRPVTPPPPDQPSPGPAPTGATTASAARPSASSSARSASQQRSQASLAPTGAGAGSGGSSNPTSAAASGTDNGPPAPGGPPPP